MSYDHLDTPFAQETDSSPLTLISHKLCPYVQRTAIALLEKEVTFQRIDIDLAAKPEWFSRISPLGKVPVLRIFTGGEETTVFESSVILEYLEETQPNPMHPKDPLIRARHRAWIEFSSATLNAIAGYYSAKSQDDFDAATQKLHALFACLENEIGPGPWFAGDRFTLVDAAFAPVFRYFDTFEDLGEKGMLAGFHRIASWRQELASRPSVQDAAVPQYSQLLTAFLQTRDSVLSQRMHFAA